jgi:NADH-quinone oxidoreductase subunit J
MTADQIIFLLCAFLILGSSIMVVITRKLIHAALWLVVALFGVAILFAILQAGFLAVVQVVVYIGAIAILFVFAVMLTRKEMLDDLPGKSGVRTRSNDLLSKSWLPALLGLLILAGLVFLILGQPTFGRTAVAMPEGVDTLRNLGTALVSPDAFVLPFEVASVLLLAALVGAVYVAAGNNK